MSIKTYTELIQFTTYEDRYNYLRLNGSVGEQTFGYDRYLNRALYKSPEWKSVREKVIVRDSSYDGPCDMAFSGYEIFDSPVVHHINPITLDDIEQGNPNVFDLENLITLTSDTHSAIHYGREFLRDKLPVIRTKGDTCPWMTTTTRLANLSRTS